MLLDNSTFGNLGVFNLFFKRSGKTITTVGSDQAQSGSIITAVVFSNLNGIILTGNNSTIKLTSPRWQ